MPQRQVLSFDQCQAAMNAMLDAAKADASGPPIAAAIVDESGNLISVARMDGARPLLVRNCIKKAYTAATAGASTEDFAAELKSHDWNVAEWGDPMMLVISGGVVVRSPADDAIMGGVGVSGYPFGPGDHDMALLGIKAMNL